MTMPDSRWQGSHSLSQPRSPHCPHQEEPQSCGGAEDSKPGHEKQHWKNPTWCSGAVKTFMNYGLIFHEPATTASNKPGIHRVEWPLSINSLSWQRLHFPLEDSFFQNLGSSEPGQHMTNNAAVSHDGCVSLATQQKQSDCQETMSENNFISFHLPSNQLLEKLICFAAAHKQTWIKS